MVVTFKEEVSRRLVIRRPGMSQNAQPSGRVGVEKEWLALRLRILRGHRSGEAGPPRIGPGNERRAMTILRRSRPTYVSFEGGIRSSSSDSSGASEPLSRAQNRP